MRIGSKNTDKGKNYWSWMGPIGKGIKTHRETQGMPRRGLSGIISESHLVNLEQGVCWC